MHEDVMRILHQAKRLNLTKMLVLAFDYGDFFKNLFLPALLISSPAWVFTREVDVEECWNTYFLPRVCSLIMAYTITSATLATASSTSTTRSCLYALQASVDPGTDDDFDCNRPGDPEVYGGNYNPYKFESWNTVQGSSCPASYQSVYNSWLATAVSMYFCAIHVPWHWLGGMSDTSNAVSAAPKPTSGQFCKAGLMSGSHNENHCTYGWCRQSRSNGSRSTLPGLLLSTKRTL